ncbi:MAG: hypothetical protein ABI885_21780 [Gammaproteobacteria bacterium]
MGKKGNAREFADTCAETWQDMHAALSPIIGSGGVSALYKRCLFLRRGEYPWLSEVRVVSPQSGDFAALVDAIRERPEAEALAANDALLAAFRQLLNNLIGAALTGQLLHTVWVKHGLAVRMQGNDQR